MDNSDKINELYAEIQRLQAEARRYQLGELLPFLQAHATAMISGYKEFLLVFDVSENQRIATDLMASVKSDYTDQVPISSNIYIELAYNNSISGRVRCPDVVDDVLKNTVTELKSIKLKINLKHWLTARIMLGEDIQKQIVEISTLIKELD